MLRRLDLEGAPSRQLLETKRGVSQFLRSSLIYLMGRIARYNVAQDWKSRGNNEYDLAMSDNASDTM